MIPGKSRTNPSTTKPAILRCLALFETRSPRTAFMEEPCASTTTTSPGFAMSRDLCTMRLSPGNTFTVQAKPHNRCCLLVRQVIAGSTAYRRLSRSEISGVSNSVNSWIKAGSKRGKSGLIRKPGPGNISAERGFWVVKAIVAVLIVFSSPVLIEIKLETPSWVALAFASVQTIQQLTKACMRRLDRCFAPGNFQGMPDIDLLDDLGNRPLPTCTALFPVHERQGSDCFLDTTDYLRIQPHLQHHLPDFPQFLGPSGSVLRVTGQYASDCFHDARIKEPAALNRFVGKLQALCKDHGFHKQPH